MLTENLACPSFGHAQLCGDMIHTSTATSGAQKFPLAASARIILSRGRSETARRRRAFSASNSFKRFTRSPFKPPYSDRLCHRFALRVQNVNLTQLSDNLFCLMSFCCHFNVLLRPISHTSKRSTFQGAVQSDGGNINEPSNHLKTGRLFVMRT